MRTVLVLLLALAAVHFAAPLAAQASPQPVPPELVIEPSPAGQTRLQNRDAVHTSSCDRPVGVVQVRVGAPNTDSHLPDPAITVDPWLPPNLDEEPTFFGEPVGESFLLMLDASGSMAGARVASLRAEATSVISKLDKDDKFDCLSFGTQFADSTLELWRKLTVATEGHKNDAIKFINGPCCNPGFGTPTHDALKAACEIYPNDLGKMFLVSDSMPNATGSVTQILQHFPGWWAKFTPRTTLVCVCIGGIEDVVNFMRDLAAQDDSTGVFVNVP